MVPDAVPTPGYREFLAQLKASIRQGQFQALRAVNRELVALYWEMGEAIHQKQEEQGWGKAVVETLARDLQAEFPGRNGLSARNLWNILDFYRSYCEQPKLQPLVAEISWAKNLVILARVKDPLEREFYLRATARFGWTKAVLQHQIDNQSYQKYLLNQTNFDQALPEEIKAQAALAVKDHYTFDFLELAEEHGERELEQALVANLRQFLTEPHPSASSSAAVKTKPSSNTPCAPLAAHWAWPVTASCPNCRKTTHLSCPARKVLPNGWRSGSKRKLNN